MRITQYSDGWDTLLKCISTIFLINTLLNWIKNFIILWSIYKFPFIHIFNVNIIRTLNCFMLSTICCIIFNGAGQRFMLRVSIIPSYILPSLFVNISLHLILNNFCILNASLNLYDRLKNKLYDYYNYFFFYSYLKNSSNCSSTSFIISVSKSPCIQAFIFNNQR